MSTPPRDHAPGSSDPAVKATVRASHAEHEGRVVGARDRVVTIEFAREDSPLFLIAEELTVSFRSREMREPFSARSRVIFRQDNPYRSRYRFRFSEKDAQALAALFKRRATARVRADGDILVEAREEGVETGECAACELRDLSSAGLSLRVGIEAEARLCRVDRLRLDFRLPGDPEPFDLVAAVRHRRLAGQSVQYGLELELPDGAEGARTRERLEAYVRRRKSSIIERALGASWLPRSA